MTMTFMTGFSSGAPLDAYRRVEYFLDEVFRMVQKIERYACEDGSLVSSSDFSGPRELGQLSPDRQDLN